MVAAIPLNISTRGSRAWCGSTTGGGCRAPGADLRRRMQELERQKGILHGLVLIALGIACGAMSRVTGGTDARGPRLRHPDGPVRRRGVGGGLGRWEGVARKGVTVGPCENLTCCAGNRPGAAIPMARGDCPGLSCEQQVERYSVFQERETPCRWIFSTRGTPSSSVGSVRCPFRRGRGGRACR